MRGRLYLCRAGRDRPEGTGIRPITCACGDCLPCTVRKWTASGEPAGLAFLRALQFGPDAETEAIESQKLAA